MTYLTIILAVVNLTLVALAIAYFRPIRSAARNWGSARSGNEACDARQSVALFKAIGETLSTHARSLVSVQQQSVDKDQPRHRVSSTAARLRDSNRETEQSLDENNRQLSELLEEYGDLYRSERRRIESYARSVSELDSMLDKFQQKAENSNQVLLQLVRDMIQENRALQDKVFDCQEQVSELIVRSVKSERDARTDVLTQLPNRRAWDEKLARLDYPTSIALIDVDDFKMINDDHGHAAGDAMLTLIGTILRNSGEVCSYRIGGDEFALLIPPGSEEGVTRRIQKKIDAAVLQFGDRKLSVCVSIGIAPFVDHESLQSTLLRADQALYRAKASKGDRAKAVQSA